MRKKDGSVGDIERYAVDEAHLTNTTIGSLAWCSINAERGSWRTDAQPIPILSKIDGYAETGRVSTLAIGDESRAERH